MNLYSFLFFSSLFLRCIKTSQFALNIPTMRFSMRKQSTHSFCHISFLSLSKWKNNNKTHARMHTHRVRQQLRWRWLGWQTHPMQILNPYIYSIKWKIDDKHTYNWWKERLSMHAHSCFSLRSLVDYLPNLPWHFYFFLSNNGFNVPFRSVIYFMIHAIHMWNQNFQRKKIQSCWLCARCESER